MKLIDKKDFAGLAMSAGVGAIVGMIYLRGKYTGEAAAYEDCNNMLQDLVEKAKDALLDE